MGCRLRLPRDSGHLCSSYEVNLEATTNLFPPVLILVHREFDRSNFFGDLFYSILPHHQVHMATTDRWKAHRKLMADTMTHAFLSDVAGPQMHRNALSMIKLWREKARLAQGHPFTAVGDIKAAAMDIIWAASFGNQMKVAESQTKLLSNLDSIDLPADPKKEAVFPSAPNPEAFDAVIKLSDSVSVLFSVHLRLISLSRNDATTQWPGNGKLIISAPSSEIASTHDMKTLRLTLWACRWRLPSNPCSQDSSTRLH